MLPLFLSCFARFYISNARQKKLLNVEEAKVERYLSETVEPSNLAWMKPISKSAVLFSNDSCRKAILDSINMAWTKDKYKDVEDKYKMKE